MEADTASNTLENGKGQTAFGPIFFSFTIPNTVNLNGAASLAKFILSTIVISERKSEELNLD
jgi:hypothetical protein